MVEGKGGSNQVFLDLIEQIVVTMDTSGQV